MTEDETGLSKERVFKKSAPNNKLTIYLSSRDLVISDNNIDKIQGVVLVDPEYLQEKKVYGQVTLTFRYGREDEEVMGLKFCNEAIMCIAQLYPVHERAIPYPTTPLQEALIRRLGPNAHPFTMEVTSLAPPSVQLLPAKEYCGAPIGTSYDVRAYVADYPDEKLHRRSTVRMAIRVVQRASVPPAPHNGSGEIPRPLKLQGSIFPPPPHATVDKPFLLSDGRVELEASLNRAIYSNSEPVMVTVRLRNNSNKTVRRIKVFVVQHVDVCMFSNGKFKNVVALINSRDECPLGPGSSLNKTYTLHPEKGATKNWIALEDSFNKTAASLAPTVTCASNSPEDRNIFAIYVSYYVKVKILVGAMGGVLALKLPFILMYSYQNCDQNCYSMPTSPLISSPLEMKQMPSHSANHQGNVSMEDKGQTLTPNSDDAEQHIDKAITEKEGNTVKISQEENQKYITEEKIEAVHNLLDENGKNIAKTDDDLTSVSLLQAQMEEMSLNQREKFISKLNIGLCMERNVIECVIEDAEGEGVLGKENEGHIAIPVVEGTGTQILSKDLKTLRGERRNTIREEDEDIMVKCNTEPT